MKYRKKPVVIEAVQWTGKNLEELCRFVPEEHRHNKVCQPMGIKTLEGVMTISEGDYIIRGIQGEFYPCKPDIFEASYEAMECAQADDEYAPPAHLDGCEWRNVSPDPRWVRWAPFRDGVQVNPADGLPLPKGLNF